jgi:hypothetical protein
MDCFDFSEYKTGTPNPLFKTPSFKVPSPQEGRRKRTGVRLSKFLPRKGRGKNNNTVDIFHNLFFQQKYPSPFPLPQGEREKQQRCRHIPQFVLSTKIPLTLPSPARGKGKKNKCLNLEILL